MKRILYGLTLFAFASVATAAIRAETYEKLMNDPSQREMIRAYVLGVGTAFELINEDILANEKGTPLYCPPAGTVMDNQRYTDILDIRIREIVDMKEDNSLVNDFTPLEPELLYGLKRAFPCR